MKEIKLYTSKAKIIKQILITLPMLALMIWIVMRENNSQFEMIMGWFGTFFFGLAIPMGIYRLIDKKTKDHNQ